jgi:signal transduction histidine kinase
VGKIKNRVKSNLIEQLANAQHAATSDVACAGLSSAPNWIDVPKSDHFVQFYETDSFLVESVSEFIGAGLGAGEAGVVIATAPHREAIEARLVTQGIDLAAVCHRKQFIALDAAHTLSLFMVDGCPDPELFDKTIGPIISQTSHGRRAVRAFGEMVAILWANGNKSGAVRLEELWNKLAEKHSFALFCAYPMRGFAGAENGEGFQHVCKAHSRVIPAESFSGLPNVGDDRLRSIALLQQKASSLEAEIAQRRQIEHELRAIKSELEVQLEELRRLHEVSQREISERKTAEARLQTSAQALDTARQQLAKANEELEARVQERTASLRLAVEQMEEFSYTVSHDLRAPLRAMTVYSQSLLEDFKQTIPHEAGRLLERISDNALRMDRMIRDVLNYSRLSRSEFPLQNISLDKLVREIVSQYPAMQADRAQITVELLADVRGHEPSLTQAISNLLANAVKFIPSGAVPTVRVWTDLSESEVRLNIQDNGIGIPLDQRARLFQMFERLHTKSSYEGTGVGLAIVRKAVERMGGKVGVSSDGKCGSCFWIILPKAQ